MTELKLSKEIKEAAKLGQIIIIWGLFIHRLVKYLIGSKCEMWFWGWQTTSSVGSFRTYKVKKETTFYFEKQTRIDKGFCRSTLFNSNHILALFLPANWEASRINCTSPCIPSTTPVVDCVHSFYQARKLNCLI